MTRDEIKAKTDDAEARLAALRTGAVDRNGLTEPPEDQADLIHEIASLKALLDET